MKYYFSSICIFLQQKVRKHTKGLKPSLVQNNRHVEYVDPCVHMTLPSPLGDGHGNRWRSHFSTSWTFLLNSLIVPFYCGSKLSCHFILALVSALTWCMGPQPCTVNGENKHLPPASLNLQCSAHWCGMWCVKEEEIGANFGSLHCNMGLFSPCSLDVTHQITFLKTDATVM
jgi:hypothetical protein